MRSLPADPTLAGRPRHVGPSGGLGAIEQSVYLRVLPFHCKSFLDVLGVNMIALVRGLGLVVSSHRVIRRRLQDHRAEGGGTLFS